MAQAKKKNGWYRLSAGKYAFYVNDKIIARRNVKDKPTDDPRKPSKPKPVSPSPIVTPPVGSFDPIGPAPIYSSGGMDWGMDFLGGARYRSTVVAEMPSGWWLGIFSNVDGFGDSRAVVEEAIIRGGIRGVRVQLLWKDDHNFTAADIPRAVLEARKWKALVQKYPIKWAFSGACENKFSLGLALEMQRAVQAELPGTIYVHSFMKGGVAIPSSPSVWNEVHGEMGALAGYYSYSFDGTNAFDSNVEEIKKKHSNAQVFFWWTYNFNGNMKALKAGEKSIPRAQRNAWPTSNQIDSLIYLRNPKGNTWMTARAIWKTHAEQYKDIPSSLDRDNKPVAIVPGSPKVLQLLADNGQVVMSSGARMSFDAGRSRYYFNEWGYLLAEKAKRIQGHPVVRLVGDGEDYGRINPAFRDGSFR